MRATGKKATNWFALYDGPPKIQRLARKVGRSMQYGVLYRHWSSAVHGSQVARRLDPSGGIKCRRHTETLSEVVTHTLNMSIMIIQLFAKFYRPGEEESFGKWYVAHIRPVLVPEAQGVTPLV
jgi:hypothetical protein